MSDLFEALKSTDDDQAAQIFHDTYLAVGGEDGEAFLTRELALADNIPLLKGMQDQFTAFVPEMRAAGMSEEQIAYAQGILHIARITVTRCAWAGPVHPSDILPPAPPAE